MSPDRQMVPGPGRTTVRMSCFRDKDIFHDEKVTKTMAQEHALVIGNRYFYANHIRENWFRFTLPPNRHNGFYTLSRNTPNLRQHLVGCIAYDLWTVEKPKAEPKWGKPQLYVQVRDVWFENEADAVHFRMVFDAVKPTITTTNGDNFFVLMDNALKVGLVAGE